MKLRTWYPNKDNKVGVEMKRIGLNVGESEDNMDRVRDGVKLNFVLGSS